MMRAGTDFTYDGKRYHAGDRFDLGSVPEHQRNTLRRLYKLSEVKRTPKTITIEGTS